jgi:tryptophan 2,3-dioxygenase
MEITPQIIERLELLEKKYSAIGQDMLSYLDGLLYNDSVKYWDYVEVDTLLSLQKPRTDFPDEVIFIMYHQITELYFKLSLREFEQIGLQENLTA